MHIEAITVGDGAMVSVHSVGSGPGVVVLHGAGVSVRDYGASQHDSQHASPCTCSTGAVGPTRPR